MKKKQFRLDKAAYMTEIGEQKVLTTLRGEEDPASSRKWRCTGYAVAHFDQVGQYNGYRYVDLLGCTAVTACVRTQSSGGVLLIRL